jgi:hypothetical protein
MEFIMTAFRDEAIMVFSFENLPSDSSKENAIAELIQIRKELTSWSPEISPMQGYASIQSLIQWHNDYLQTESPYFTEKGKYFGNESYFSHFLYLVQNASFRGTYYVFQIKNYPHEDHFFKADTPSPPQVYPWAIMEFVSHKEFIATPPSPLPESHRVFDTANDLIQYVETLHDTYINR